MFKVDDKYEFLTKELLEEEYITNKLTDKKIAEKYNIGSKATVWKRRQYYGIKNKCQNKSNKNARVNRKFVISKEDAIKLQSEEKTYEEMAEIVGCSRMVLYRRIKELGLVEKRNQVMNKIKFHEELSNKQIEFILGDLLGDGCVTSSGMYQCSHSYKQKSFIEYKKEILSNIISPNFKLKERLVNNHQNGKQYKTYYLRTLSNKHLKKINQAYYGNKIKKFPFDYLMNSNFSAFSLATWYMGDGSRVYNIPSLYTFSFEYEGNLQIQLFLKKKFDLETYLMEDKSNKKRKEKRFFIRMKKGKSSQRFFDLVRPHIIPLFNYKLP